MELTKSIKFLIFDFDGTIADTRTSIVETVKLTLEEMGLRYISEAAIQQKIGLPLRETFIEVAGLGGEDLRRAISLYRRKYNSVALEKVQLFPRVREVLLYFAGKKEMALISSKGEVALIKLLERLGIKNFFSWIIGEEGVFNKKPHPEGVNIILKRWQALPTETLVVGDTTFDIEMGKRAGCYTCAVTYGNHPLDALRLSNPDYIINNFAELQKILESEREKLKFR